MYILRMASSMRAFVQNSHPSLFSRKLVKPQWDIKWVLPISLPSLRSSSSSFSCRTVSCSSESVEESEMVAVSSSTNENKYPSSSTSVHKKFPLLGLEDVMMGYITGKKKATEVAHSVWKHIVRKGDAVIDATCGNGYDTLAMVKMVMDDSQRGHVYGMDVQKVALENTSSLLDRSLSPHEKALVELFLICHSKMEEVVPKGATVRLVAFNLGYLPGGDKGMITRSDTTVLALESAERILAPGGLISIVVYIGHAGGREELEAVEAFATRLPVDHWICCKIQTLNRPLAPVIVFLFKK